MGQVSSEVMDARSFKGEWKLIGAGGFGAVFKARHRQWGKDVAIKILGPDKGSFDSNKALDREAKLMLSADNPFIVKCLGIFRGCTPGCAVIQVGLVMDLVESGSLKSLQEKRERQPLPWPLVVRLVHQLAEGMKYLHNLTPDAIIHKDLMPDNILLDSDLNVKITNFDIAKFVDAVTTNSLKQKCTPFYAPPEARKGGATTAYDVYSYAILVWTLLNPAFDDTTVRFLARPGVRPSLEKVKSMEVPGLEELVELMERCWNEDPTKRPTFAECTAVTQRLYEMNQSEIQGKVERVKTQRDFQRLTLDTNTTCRVLSLSENNKKVTWDGQDHSYPDHSDRFDSCPQVLCTESLTGRCYWEVEWSGWGGVEIAVTYRGIRRKGWGVDCGLGENDKSWSLVCTDEYAVRHNGERTVLPVSPSSVSTRVDRYGKVRTVYSGRVAVYVDHPAGTLSFYAVSSDTLTHLHTFQTTFTKPLYAGFCVGFGVGWSGSSVCLCE